VVSLSDNGSDFVTSRHFPLCLLYCPVDCSNRNSWLWYKSYVNFQRLLLYEVRACPPARFIFETGQWISIVFDIRSHVKCYRTNLMPVSSVNLHFTRISNCTRFFITETSYKINAGYKI